MWEIIKIISERRERRERRRKSIINSTKILKT
jgi:hypothetical protein